MRSDERLYFFGRSPPALMSERIAVGAVEDVDLVILDDLPETPGVQGKSVHLEHHLGRAHPVGA